MQLNRAVSMRLMELLSEKNMTQYQLSTKSGLPRSTVSNIINCTYPSMKLRIVHELCQGLEIGINAFFFPHYLMKQILNHNRVPRESSRSIAFSAVFSVLWDIQFDWIPHERSLLYVMDHLSKKETPLSTNCSGTEGCYSLLVSNIID